MLPLRASLVVKNPPAMQETQVPFMCQEDTLEKGMASHFLLQNPTDTRGRRATVHGVAESRTLATFTPATHTSCL